MTSLPERFAEQAWDALGGRASNLKRLGFASVGALPSLFPVSDFAAGAVGVAALAIAELVSECAGSTPEVVVDRRLASFWFGWSIRPLGWKIPSLWDSIAGDYLARDGWIRLHTNAPRHRAAALRVLGAPEDRAAVASAVAGWSAHELENAVVEAGGCAAEMRSAAAWESHPQGRAVASEPLVATTRVPAPAFDPSAVGSWRLSPERPLAGLKVLDLTRVLAGPVATRFLAGYGADVLRIDSPDWDEPGVIPDVTLGKRCARLDLSSADDRRAFAELLSRADIFVHGYRPGALERLGFGLEARRSLAPALIEVTLDAYGWTGPWAGRRGFDSLVQMSAGIADAGMTWKKADRPTPLPVQALDHATGYLMAAAAVRAVTGRVRGEGAAISRLSLARTAKLLADHAGALEEAPFASETPDDLAAGVERTDWGDAKRLRPPAIIEGTVMHWDRPASALGSAAPDWRAPT